ncbi:MAG: TonB family protein [Pseudomonadota bacterium]
MIRRSTAIALTAITLSLFMHLLGIGWTVSVEPAPAQQQSNANTVAFDNAFEDVVDAVAEPVEPEPAPAPEPPEQTTPIDTPTSQAFVASANPQASAVPDTGAAIVKRPDATGPAEAEQGETPEPETIEASAGDASEISDAQVAPPSGSDAVTEIARAESLEPQETAQADSARIAALPALPEVSPPVTSLPDAATVPIVPLEPLEEETREDADASELAVTASLRPRLPTQRPPVSTAGLEDGSDALDATRRAPSDLIESPLAAYKRDGTNLFAGRSGGARSGGVGFLNSRNTGNSDVTNYAGQVLVHLNRVKPAAVSARGWARVFFEISPDGSLAWVDIIDGSGSREVDRAARAHIKNAVPFPRPPNGNSRKLNFVYQIR